MKKIILYSSIFFVLFPIILFSQFVTVIDYRNLSTSSCNIFGSPITINGLTHTANIGQPTYNPIDSAIVLDATVTLNNTVNPPTTKTYLGTQFQIAYNFKKGFAYEFDINAWDQNSSSPKSDLRLDLNNGGNGTSSQCNGPELIDNNTSGNLKIAKKIYWNSVLGFSNYQYFYYPLSANQAFLVVAAIPESGSQNHHIEIKSITIKEIGPLLTLTPSTIQIPCSSATTQIFTVNNAFTAPDNISYQWNMGSNNGWLFNNAQAPSTINTTTNSIELTSDPCGALPQNFSVTVFLNSIPFKTYNDAVSSMPPNLSIVGSTFLCSGNSNYSINNLPCNATVSWNVNPSTGVVDYTLSGNTLILSKVANGNVTVTATVNGTNCSVSPISKSITVTSIPDYIGISSFTNLNSCDVANFAIQSTQGGGSQYLYAGELTVVGAFGQESAITWSNPFEYYSNTPVIWSDQGNGNLSIGTNYSNASIFLRASATNDCGSYYKDFMFQAGTCMIIESIITPTNKSTVQIYPNPTTGLFTASISALNKKVNIKEIIITDKMGKAIYQQKLSSNLSQQTINLSSMPADIYMVKIFDGSIWTTKQLILKY